MTLRQLLLALDFLHTEANIIHPGTASLEPRQESWYMSIVGKSHRCKFSGRRNEGTKAYMDKCQVSKDCNLVYVNQGHEAITSVIERGMVMKVETVGAQL